MDANSQAQRQPGNRKGVGSPIADMSESDLRILFFQQRTQILEHESDVRLAWAIASTILNIALIVFGASRGWF
jgi:hypothetical protein